MATSDHAVEHQDRVVERASERVIAGERLVGVRPWTIGDFNAAGKAPAPPPSVRVTAEHLPTADEVEAIAQQARDEGFRAGLEEARAINDRMGGLVTGFGAALGRLERDMAGSLLKLAIDLARQVLRESINVRPELITPLVEEALAGIARGAAPGALHLNPEDLPIVEERMGDALAHAGWKSFADDSIERGGCRVTFDGGEVDATIESRWARVMSQLGREDGWLV